MPAEGLDAGAPGASLASVVEARAHLMTDPAKVSAVAARDAAAHDNVDPDKLGFVQGAVQSTNPEDGNDRIRRTVAGAIHPISWQHTDRCVAEVALHGNQRVPVGEPVRRTRKGRMVRRPI